MSSPFTDREIEGAVEKILRSSIRRPVTSLGSRDAGTTFNDFQEQATAVMTMTPNAPFYVVRLGCDRLDDKIRGLSSTLIELDAAVQAIGRPMKVVESTTDLANARVAAEALSLAGQGRTSSFDDMEKVPAFMRLDRNIQSFLNAYSAPNLKKSGQVVRTPQEGRNAIPGLVRSLKEERQDLIENTTSLASSMDDYEKLNLPYLLSSGVTDRAAQVIAEREAQLSALSPQARVGVLRDCTLDLIAARTIIRNFGSLRAPTTFLVSDGMGGPYADATHPATPASLVVELAGPYATRVDTAAIFNQLDFLLDGTLRRTVTVGGSFLACLVGRVPETFNISGTNNLLTVSVTKLGVVSTVQTTLTSGAARTTQQICNDLNPNLSPFDLEAIPGLNPRKYQGQVNIGGVSPAAVTFTQPAFSQTQWTNIGILDGDRIKVIDGANATAIYQVNIGGVSATVLTCTYVSGPAFVAEVDKTIEIGGPSSVVKIKVKDSVAATALAQRWKLSVGLPDDTVEVSACATLGFTAGSTTTCRPLPAQTIADAVNSNSTTAVSGVSRLTASVTQRPISLPTALTELGVHTEPSATTTAYIFRFRGRGACTVGGLVATFVIPELEPLTVGDEFVIRSSPNQADVGKRGVVTSSSGNTVVATFLSGISTGSDLLVDISPDLTGLPLDAVLTIDDGPNKGTYRVTSQGTTIRSELKLNRAFPVPQGFSGQPVEMTGNLLEEALTISSTVTDLTTSVQLDDGVPPNPKSAAFLFSSVRPVAVPGTTDWYQLEDLPKNIQVGDIIELYDTSYTTPAASLEVAAIDTSVRAVRFTTLISTSTAPVSFSLGDPLPYGRIRSTRRNNFSMFNLEASIWLALPEMQTKWVTELDRLVTKLLSDPSSVNVNTLRTYLANFLGLLTVDGALANSMPSDNTIEAIASSYQADHIPEVDTLVKSLLQQGGDRAVDVLLEGKFSTYFGFSMDEMSYAGNVLSLTKQVMQQDLPVSAVNRKEARQQQVLLGSYEEPDYEFDYQDIDTGLVPDAPGGNPAPRSGDAF